MRSAAWILSSVILFACGGEPGPLIVELTTDYRPQVDFDSVRTELIGFGGPISAGVTTGDDFRAGRRIAEYDRVPAGSYDLRVTLFSSTGATVDGRTQGIDVDGPTAVTVEITARMDGGLPDGCVPDERGELCNGLDDDCDALVDEGHDADGDGYTWCGGGLPGAADCDDGDPSAHPGDSTTAPGIEACDGSDNDCDGAIDEDDGSGELCPSGLSCVDRLCADPIDCSLPSVRCSTDQFCDFDATPPRCIPGGCTPGSCPSAQVCNVETGACVAPAPIGDTCLTDEDCADGGLCVPGEAFGLTSARRCTVACCTDSDCAAGTICWGSGSGAKLCAPPSLVGGAASMDPCAGDDDCTGDDACVFAVSSTTEGHFSCDESLGADGQGEPSFSGGCRSGLMSGIHACTGVTCAPVCVGPCRTTTDCPSSVFDLDFYCGFGQLGTYESVVALCREKTHGGEGTSGAACVNHGGCRDSTCVSGGCADTCCSNADCTGSAVCRPLQIRGRWETHCL